METISNFDAKQCVARKPLITKSGKTIPLFRIDSLYSLTQAVGYAKFLNGSSHDVFLRGQSVLYQRLYPSLFRQVQSARGMKRAMTCLSQFIAACRTNQVAFNDVPDDAHEPLLQHYGIRTKWIDLVDNLWVALWFGCHTCQVDRTGRDYVHFYARHKNDGNNASLFYILLVATDATQEDKWCPGFKKGPSTYVMDLRKACPSMFLRPHAQHAVLARHKNLDQYDDADLMDQVCGILEVTVENGLSWLGSGNLLSVSNLFPPANYDYGYQRLLENVPVPSTASIRQTLGTINLNFA